MRTKIGALVMAALCAVYIILLGDKGFLFISSGHLAGIVMGTVLLVLPAVGLFGIGAELLFGVRLERLGKTLQRREAYPRFDFELRPSGRATRDSADAEFERISALAQADPENWTAWYALGIAYDAAGDRRRARVAMRKAIKLARANDADALKA